MTAIDDAPTVVGQRQLSVKAGEALLIDFADLTVVDPDSGPGILLLRVLDGDNYTVRGNQITPDIDFSGALTVRGMVVRLSASRFHRHEQTHPGLGSF